jgi:hypothetical protein
MKIYFNTILGLTLTIVFTACGSELYTKKELRTQIVPEALKGKIWTLRKIYSEKILDSSMTDEFNNSNGTKNCSLFIWWVLRIHLSFCLADSARKSFGRPILNAKSRPRSSDMFLTGKVKCNLK